MVNITSISLVARCPVLAFRIIVFASAAAQIACRGRKSGPVWVVVRLWRNHYFLLNFNVKKTNIVKSFLRISEIWHPVLLLSVFGRGLGTIFAKSCRRLDCSFFAEPLAQACRSFKRLAEISRQLPGTNKVLTTGVPNKR